jgi:hypothetical protein
MKIIDLADCKAADAMIRETVRGWRLAHYDEELLVKTKKEQEELKRRWICSVRDEKDIKNVIQMFQQGIEFKGISYKPVASELEEPLFHALWDEKKDDVDIPYRFEKLWIWMFGKAYGDDNTIVWNNGNRLKKWTLTQEEMASRCAHTDSVLIQEFINAQRIKAKHVYRNQVNRHTHSNNKPSYFAFGYNMLDAYFSKCTQHEVNEYYRIHTNCCGQCV